MPYILKHLRAQAARVPLNAGELNYAITSWLLEHPDETRPAKVRQIRNQIDAYLQRRGKVDYSAVNEVIGVLTCAALEADRRLQDGGALGDLLTHAATQVYEVVAVPLEDLKCAVNGDVY